MRVERIGKRDMVRCNVEVRYSGSMYDTYSLRHISHSEHNMLLMRRNATSRCLREGRKTWAAQVLRGDIYSVNGVRHADK